MALATDAGRARPCVLQRQRSGRQAPGNAEDRLWGYNPNMVAIKASALLQAWPEQVLPALALRVVTDKLNLLLTQRLSEASTEIVERWPACVAEAWPTEPSIMERE